MNQVDLQLAQAGNPAAFERLVTPHLQGLYGFLQRRMGQEADDVYQETLLGAWKTIGSFQGGSSIKTWLFAIAGYKCADAIRKKGRTPVPAEMLEEPAQESFEEDSMRRMDISSALARLDPEDSSLMYLVYTQGFSNKEAAETLNIPEGTVKSRLYRLRSQMRDQLKGSL